MQKQRVKCVRLHGDFPRCFEEVSVTRTVLPTSRLEGANFNLVVPRILGLSVPVGNRLDRPSDQGATTFNHNEYITFQKYSVLLLLC